MDAEGGRWAVGGAQVLFYSHLTGCVFYFVGRHEEVGQSWLAAYMWNDDGESRPLTEAPMEIQYLAALYFAVVSVTSVSGGLTPVGG